MRSIIKARLTGTERRRPGRPALEKNRDKINVTLRLRRAFYTSLKEFARAKGLAPGEAVMIVMGQHISSPTSARETNRTQSPEPQPRTGMAGSHR